MRLFLRIVVVIALVSIGTIEIWMIYGQSPKTQATDLSKLTSAGEDEVEYGTIRSIAMFTAALIREKNIKTPLSQKDLARLIVDNQSTNKSVPGIFYEVDNDGFLVDLNSKRKYKVFSDGIQVTVAPQPEGVAVTEPIFTADKSQ